MSSKPKTLPFREIAITEIDEPATPIRTATDRDALEALAQSIAEVGVIQPIGVVQTGERFEIVHGHRRFLAARMAGLHTVPARILSARRGDVLAIMLHENVEREDLNPIDEGLFFQNLIDQGLAADTDAVADLVRRSRPYVETRIAIVQGDPEVRRAVEDEQISMAVGLELLAYRDPKMRLTHLDSAIKGGASARIVRNWRTQHERLAQYVESGEMPESGQHLPPEQPAGSLNNCIICDSNEDGYDLVCVYIHRACKRLFFDRIMASLRPAPAPPSPEEGR